MDPSRTVFLPCHRPAGRRASHTRQICTIVYMGFLVRPVSSSKAAGELQMPVSLLMPIQYDSYPSERHSICDTLRRMGGAAACKPKKCWTARARKQKLHNCSSECEGKVLSKIKPRKREASLDISAPIERVARTALLPQDMATGNTFHRWPVPACLLIQVVHERVPSDETTLMAPQILVMSRP